MPTNISNGQTPLLVSDFVTRLQNNDHDYFVGAPDFIKPFATVLPLYAKSYTANSGAYYKVPSQTSAPTAFSTAQYAVTGGNIYEQALPADCIDNGLLSLEVFYGTTGVTPLNVTVQQADETQWIIDATNTNQIFWKQQGRKFRAFIPTLYSASSPLQYTTSYQRFPTLPAVVGDAIDAPAEDIDTLFQKWSNYVQIA